MKILSTVFVLTLSGIFIFSSKAVSQSRYSIVIDEIMADPTPQIALPNSEWLELRNTTATAINLQGFRLGKPGATPSGAMPSFVLQPDSCVIVCTASQVAGLSVFGRTTSVTSFPSLGNDGDQLMLLSPTGAIIHTVEYSSSWYKNAVKAEGGWTLEMIDTKNPCTGIDNWTASTDAKGGTPGQKNSVDKSNADNTAPKLLRCFAISPNSLQLLFSEPLDSLKAALAANYSLSDGIGISAATPVAPFFTRVTLSLASPLTAGKVYTISTANLTDCSGKTIDNNYSIAKAGLSSLADTNDIVVNEILFNPAPLGTDYVELYNRSNKIINLQELILANRSSTTGQPGNLVAITTDAYPFFPQEHLVITADPQAVLQQYNVANPANLVKAASMPSLPDDKGRALLMNNAGKTIDELAYTEQMHFALVDNKEGIALERISYHQPTQLNDNWTSAAATAKFGTPTAPNSQLKNAGQPLGQIAIEPKIFSPDNDGFDDFALIRFQFTQPGFVANITIMDAAGRPVRVLQRNALCAASGSFRWDGLNDKQQRVPVGTYVIFTEIFNLEGKKQAFKNTVVVARKW